MMMCLLNVVLCWVVKSHFANTVYLLMLVKHNCVQNTFVNVHWFGCSLTQHMFNHDKCWQNQCFGDNTCHVQMCLCTSVFVRHACCYDWTHKPLGFVNCVFKQTYSQHMHDLHTHHNNTSQHTNIHDWCVYALRNTHVIYSWLFNMQIHNNCSHACEKMCQHNNHAQLIDRCCRKLWSVVVCVLMRAQRHIWLFATIIVMTANQQHTLYDWSMYPHSVGIASHTLIELNLIWLERPHSTQTCCLHVCVMCVSNTINRTHELIQWLSCVCLFALQHQLIIGYTHPHTPHHTVCRQTLWLTHGPLMEILFMCHCYCVSLCASTDYDNSPWLGLWSHSVSVQYMWLQQHVCNQC